MYMFYLKIASAIFVIYAISIITIAVYQVWDIIGLMVLLAAAIVTALYIRLKKGGEDFTIRSIKK